MNDTPRNVVNGSQPHPIYLAHLSASDEADAARAAVKAARRQLKAATRRHEMAIAASTMAQCAWILLGDRT